MPESDLVNYLTYGEDENALQAQGTLEEVEDLTVHDNQQQDVQKELPAKTSTGRIDSLPPCREGVSRQT